MRGSTTAGPARSSAATPPRPWRTSSAPRSWSPRASEVQNHLGLAYAEQGRHADALAAFRRAVEIDCGNEAAQRNLHAAEARAAAEEASR